MWKRATWNLLVLIGWSLAQCAPAADFDLVGQIVPEAAASVSLHGATTPFESATLSDERGRFRFRKLAPGAYTLAVFQPAFGEARQTVRAWRIPPDGSRSRCDWRAASSNRTTPAGEAQPFQRASCRSRREPDGSTGKRSGVSLAAMLPARWRTFGELSK